MTYATGSRILASDYNNFCGASAANVSTQLNTVLGTGRGNAGYGQTIVSNVASTNKVLASHWNSLITGINTVRKQQNGAGFSNLSSYTTGTRILANVNVSGNLSSAYSNRLSSQADGTTIAGSGYSPNFTAPNDSNPATFAFSRTATFASGDAARYFFNAGGQVNFIVTSVTNGGGTSRGTALADLAATNFTSMKFRAANNGGRTGSGGTLSSSDTALGYYKSTTSNVSAVVLASTSYAGDTCTVYAKTNGVQGSNADNGTTLTMSMVLFSAAGAGINDQIDITVNHKIDVIYPSTTFLANTWGSVTIS